MRLNTSVFLFFSRRYEFTEPVTKYFYKWHICASAAAETDAIIQSGGKNKQHPIALGRFSNSTLVGGSKYSTQVDTLLYRNRDFKLYYIIIP